MATPKRNHNKKHMCVACGDPKLKFHTHVISCVGATRDSARDLLSVENARVDSLGLQSYTIEELKAKYDKTWPVVAHAYVSAGIPIKIKRKKAVSSVKDLQSFLNESKIGQFVSGADGNVSFKWCKDQVQPEINPVSTSSFSDQGKTNELNPPSSSGTACAFTNEANIGPQLRGMGSQNAHVLQAVLILVKELDRDSLETVQTAIRKRLENL